MYIRHLTILLVFIILPLTETFSQEISKFQSDMKVNQKRYNTIKWLSTKSKKYNIKITIKGPNNYSQSYTPTSYEIEKTYSGADNMARFEYELPQPLTKWVGGKGDYIIEIRDDDSEFNFIKVKVGPRFHWTLKVLPIVLVGAYFGYQFLMEPTSQRQSLPAPPEPN